MDRLGIEPRNTMSVYSSAYEAAALTNCANDPYVKYMQADSNDYLILGCVFTAYTIHVRNLYQVLCPLSGFAHAPILCRFHLLRL